MKKSGVLLKLILISFAFIIMGIQTVQAEPFTATYTTSDMWPVQGSTTEKLVVYYKSQEELLTCTQINGKMEANRYKIPAGIRWVGVANSNIYIYNGERTIKKYNVSTGKTQDIVKIADTFAKPYSDGKYVYYLKGAQLYAIDPQTDKSKAVLTVPGLNGFSTSYSAKSSALIYNISVVDGYFYYVLSKSQKIGTKTIYIPSVLYRVPLKGQLVPEALIKFDDNNASRAPGMPYLIKNNMLVMANQNKMLDLTTKKYIPINNACLNTYIIGNQVYQKLPDGSYKEMNITNNGSFIEDKVYKDMYQIPISFGNYSINVYGDVIKLANNNTKEKKYFGTVKLAKYDMYELKLIGDGAPYTVISDPNKKHAFENALKVIKDLIKPDMSESEKVKVLHDWIIDNTAFDYDTFNESKVTDESYYWVGLFNNHFAVSAGYASGYNILLGLAGIESKYTTGTGTNGGSHAWNTVKIDGNWIQIDPTLDDIGSMPEKGLGK